MKKRYLAVFISALVSSLPFSFSQLWFLTLAFPSVFFYLLFKSEDKKEIRHISFIWAVTYYLGIHYYFIALYPLDFAGLSNFASLLVVIIGWIGISLFQGSELALFFILFKRINKKLNLLSPLVLGALFALCEWLQSLFWFGFPWGQLALTQHAFLPFIQSLSLFGPYFITFIIVSINGCLALFFTSKKRLPLILALLIFVSNTVFGTIRLYTEPLVDKSVSVAIVQPSLMSGEKWDLTKGKSAFDVHVKMSEKLNGADLIVWSETAVPSDLADSSYRMEIINNLLREKDCDLLTGAFHGKYNAALYIDENGVSTYFKQRLVPFGEYVPMRGFIEAVLPFMADINMLSSDLSAGEESTVFETDNGKIGALVCFDSIFTNLARNSAKNGAELITIITNDSWYKTSTALTHHNAQAVFRAVENNRWVVRCANSGISSFIDSRGRITTQTEPLECTSVTENVSLVKNKTLYTLTGNIFTPITALLLAAYVLLCKKVDP